MLVLDKTVMHVLDCCEKEEITQADILALYVFAAIMQNLPLEIYINVMTCFFSIPNKKQKALKEGCQKAQRWMLERLAKRYYKKALKPERLAYIKSGEMTVVQLVKRTIIKLFLQQMQEEELPCYDVQALREKSHKQLLFIYTVLCLQHDCELAEAYASEIFTKPQMVALFLTGIEEIGKTEILKTKLENVVLNIGCLLYDHNNSGSNKLRHVAGAEHVRTAYLAYLNNVEQAALEAIDEVSLTEQKIIAERKQYSSEINKVQQQLLQYKKRNDELQKEVKLLQEENTSLKKKALLSKQKVLVVGDTCRKDGYKEIVEGYGGSFLFVDGADEAKKAACEAKKADLIIHVTAYGKHVAHDNLKQYNNVYYVNNAGLSTFRQTLEDRVG